MSGEVEWLFGLDIELLCGGNFRERGKQHQVNIPDSESPTIVNIEGLFERAGKMLEGPVHGALGGYERME